MNDASQYVIMGIDDKLNILRFGQTCLGLKLLLVQLVWLGWTCFLRLEPAADGTKISKSWLAHRILENYVCSGWSCVACELVITR